MTKNQEQAALDLIVKGFAYLNRVISKLHFCFVILYKSDDDKALHSLVLEKGLKF